MKYNYRLSEIKSEAINLGSKSDEELNIQIETVKKRAQTDSLESILAKWFALVQEVSYRQLGFKHYDTQLVAGLLLHEGKIVEMKTGEGKTLASTLPVSLNALTGSGVHVVTVNEYLAKRDQQWMGKVYRGLGLTVGLSNSGQDLAEKRKNYDADITYTTNSELVFDYLRDSSAYSIDELVQRKPLNYCILDEIDSILIDEARTPLIISASKGPIDTTKLYYARFVASSLKERIDFEIDEKKRDIHLTEKGYEKARTLVGKKSLYELDDPWILEILNALKAQHIFKLNKDYIISNNKIAIVDEFSGRVMEDRRWSLGLHESVEVKENVEVGEETQTKTSITYQNFFTLYRKLAGMTGTAKTAEQEFKDIYNLKVEVVPTAKTLIRNDVPDLLYQTELSKWKAVLNQSIECFQKGQPILIGTSNVLKSEFLSALFEASNIPHELLNAKPENVSRESEIVAQAGERSAVTIATNMAGRGTDIILGGNPTFKVKKKLTELFLEETKPGSSEPQIINKLMISVFEAYMEKLPELQEHIEGLPYSLDQCFLELQNLYDYLFSNAYQTWQTENEFVKNIGGLFVLGTERHENRRIDNQLRGRAGRQGDPGISQFFVSLDDDLVKVFGGDSIRKWVEFLVNDKDAPLQSSMLTNSLEQAQKKVELFNYELRKNVFEYDNVINGHRKNLFSARKTMLLKSDWYELFLRYQEINSMSRNPEEDLRPFFARVRENVDIPVKQKYKKSKKRNIREKSKNIWLRQDLWLAEFDVYQTSFFQKNYTFELLQTIDLEWSEHLERMNYIRETIGWRSYGQQNPLVEYNLEAFKSYQKMFRQIHQTMLHYFLNTELSE